MRIYLRWRLFAQTVRTAPGQREKAAGSNEIVASADCIVLNGEGEELSGLE
jgi:hypothetical protein